MSRSHVLLKSIRLIHLYLGVFLAPALLFFALTGALQTFSLHETTAGSSYKPPAWIATLAQLHKKQTAEVRVRVPKPPAAPKPDGGPTAAGGPAGTVQAEPPATPARPKSHLPMKIFFLLASVGLFSSTLSGLYMAFKFQRNHRLVMIGLIAAGIVVPLLLLPF